MGVAAGGGETELRDIDQRTKPRSDVPLFQSSVAEQRVAFGAGRGAILPVEPPREPYCDPAQISPETDRLGGLAICSS
jgi:hypothetical protein